MSDSASQGEDGSYASYACSTCRQQKRKCTKELPKCSLCTRLDKTCEYIDVTNTGTTTAEEILRLQNRIDELEAKLASTSESSSSQFNNLNKLAGPPKLSGNGCIPEADEFPTVFFLDSEIFQEARPAIPRGLFSIPHELTALLGGREGVIETAAHFFRTIHQWLPFVSKKRLELSLSNRNVDLKLECAALVLGMKLVLDNPSGWGGRKQTSLYHFIKDYFSVLESHGFISIRLIQTSIMIAVYEIGHGIYPAAYLSPSRSVRLGQAFGLDNHNVAPQMLRSRPGAWAEVEEVNRTWLSAMLLDRFVNLGIDGHSLATDDLPENAMLPANDVNWDHGELSTTEPLFATRPTNVNIGPFARTCQAMNLIGKYIRHRNDLSVEGKIRFHEAKQLHRTISAFSKILPDEVTSNPLQCSTAMGLTYSAMIHLYSPYTCTANARGAVTPEQTEMQTIAIAGLRSTAGDVLQFARLLRPCLASDLDCASPFVIECLYQSAATWAWLVHEFETPACIEAYREMKELLVMLDQRWKVAGEYLKIIEQTKHFLFNDNPLL